MFALFEYVTGDRPLPFPDALLLTVMGHSDSAKLLDPSLIKTSETALDPVVVRDTAPNLEIDAVVDAVVRIADAEFAPIAYDASLNYSRPNRYNHHRYASTIANT